MATEKFTFFFTASSPFSQWHHCEFTGKPLFKEVETEITFYNAEQWMMFNKALLFEDEKCAKDIMEDPDPKAVKAIGREIKNFNQKTWDEHKRDIVYEGNKLKFGQNRELLDELRKTVGTTMVEASPFDRIWGIGLSANNPKAKARRNWRGQNLLGQILTNLRVELIGE